MKYLFFLIWFLIPAYLCGQGQYSGYSEIPFQNREGVVNIVQDIKLDILLSRHLESNKKLSGVPGFRIRIFSQSGHNARANANQVRGEFLRRYPDMEGYLTYDAPNFKVYVGDFRTRSEALKFYKRLVRDFPSAFIIADRINFPKD
jgi:hypothetical protein